MASFKQYVIEEGELWDAVKFGLSTGLKAFSKKREQQKAKSEPKTILRQMLSAEGEELKAVVKKIVDNGYTVKDGRVQKPSPVKHINSWLYECTTTRTESGSAK